ncbi:PE-PPE domain-containing protein [Mycolicibacter sp. MYC123]|uniref:PE-PPE domain-containing protein n=1 Tax=[Mycobacterium] zoologicum TaxID=2872311 RepID=A0ABU5YN76_9MYCO|nr:MULTISPECIES: PE-PPE domain-containing protein [unclassified Mycolicibacter]MEB3051522.1 PE-PPE domain-containing protein [Mycolicibacter sp. MYC123]MEB3064713.1 PE-PPE domain-containing protein [Mycolicibacter sp. MYC101]
MFRLHSMLSLGLVGAGVLVAPPAPPVQDHQIHAVQLAGADSSLGGGTAFVLGPSGIPNPTQAYADQMERLYLAPLGFTGTTQVLDTPEALYPITGVKSLPFDTSVAQGQQILENAIMNQIATGNVSADNPVVVFGWSQSAVISAQLMPVLAANGVPSDYVHFVLVGDESIPNGGSLSMFDLPAGAHPAAPALGLTFSGAQPNDLYPTTVYTNEYDGFADFPRYPINELSTLNALMGIIFQHLGYGSLTPEQIADAIALPTSAADSLTSYYVIPAQYLPLLEPLLLFGHGGKVLYDLLEPDMRVLVNLGYGSLTEGWNQGPADVPTSVGLFPNIDLGQLFTALVTGAQTGFTNALNDLADPTSGATGFSDALSPLVTAANMMGFTDATSLDQLMASPSDLLDLAQNALRQFAGFPISDVTFASSPTDIINMLTGTLAADYATLLPIADTINALLTSLPAAGIDYLLAEFSAGDPITGIEGAIGALAGLVPFAFMYGTIAPVAEAIGGTLVNLVGLFDVAP